MNGRALAHAYAYAYGVRFCNQANASLQDLTPLIFQACDGLADAIERGISPEDAIEIIAARARNTGAMGLFGTQPGQIDTLVLGTHYPLICEQLQALVSADVTQFENDEAVARQT